MNLGENIHRYRTEKNMSQGDLADALDVSRQSVSKWENNSATPELEKLIKMSELFGLTLDELVNGKTFQKPEILPPAPSDSPPKTHSAREYIGIVACIFGILALLALAVSGEFLVGLIIGFPVILIGVILLAVKQFTPLWCCWCIALVLSAAGTLTTAAAIWMFLFTACNLVTVWLLLRKT